MNFSSKFLVTIVFVSILFVSCAKSTGSGTVNPPPQANVVITSYTPLHAYGGDSLTITGTGFSATGLSDTVRINGLQATVLSATATTLVVQVPAKAGSGSVSVAVGIKNNTGTTLFAYDWQVYVSTFAGSGLTGPLEGPDSTARFYNPAGVAIAIDGTVYVADQSDLSVRKISSRQVTTLAGGVSGYKDSTGTAAKFNSPMGVAVDRAGDVYVADPNNHVVRKIDPAAVVTTFAGSGIDGYQDGPGATAQFYTPYGVAVDSSGNVYVADYVDSRIRKISPTGVVSNLAGNGISAYMEGTGSSAEFNQPTGVAADRSGNVYVADKFNERIRKISPAGVVTTLAGGTKGYVDSTGAAAQFNNPTGVAVDSAGNVYVADEGNYRIRRISPAGVVTTLAGNGTPAFRNGPGATAEFSDPYGIGVDRKGVVYVADMNGNRIRSITIQ
jgi:sugar lactone lactonase YvrE